MYNTLINNCELQTVANFAGGNYRYEHCTFAAFSFDFFRQQPSVILSNNVVLADNSLLNAPLMVEMSNSILWGNLPDELLLSNDPSSGFNIDFTSSIIRSRQYSSDPLFQNNLMNVNPLFIDPEEKNYRLDTLSPAKDAGAMLGITTDLEGNLRDILPDIGAYERQED